MEFMLKRLLRAQIRRTIGPILSFSLVGYFSYHIIQGNYGILAWKNMDSRLAEAKIKLASLSSLEQRLSRKVALMRPSSVCPDLLEEQARKILGFTRSSEVVVVHPPYVGNSK